VTRARLPALGYLYVALALPALVLGTHHRHAASSLFTGAAFAYLWFVASLRAKLVRYDPDGFFASVVVLGGSAYLALQALAQAAEHERVIAIRTLGPAHLPPGRRTCPLTGLWPSALSALRGCAGRGERA